MGSRNKFLFIVLKIQIENHFAGGGHLFFTVVALDDFRLIFRI
jgi:hypothetical protein